MSSYRGEEGGGGGISTPNMKINPPSKILEVSKTRGSIHACLQIYFTLHGSPPKQKSMGFVITYVYPPGKWWSPYMHRARSYICNNSFFTERINASF